MIRRRGGWLLLTVAVVSMLSLIGGQAGAERSQRGNLIVTLDGGITPRKLPRDRRAPVTVHLLGGVHTADGSPIPRVNWIRLELAWRGQLQRHGLPVCPQARLRSTDNRQAMRACGGAAVGRGNLYAEIFVPNQDPFGVHANLIAFNGQTKAGRPAVLVHAYTNNPPVSFIIPFTVRHNKGAFRTVLVTTIRRSVGPWPHVANFQIKVSRTFDWKGKKRSYLSASCPVPRNFTAGFLSFARATYTFAGGEQLTTESVRSCRAR
jgi:hypothetical protein